MIWQRRRHSIRAFSGTKTIYCRTKK